MVLRMLEGFETKQHSTYLGRIYTQTGSLPGYVTGRKAGKAGRSSSYSFASGALVGSVVNTWVVGFAIRKTDDNVLGGAAVGGLELRDSGGDQCTLIMVNGDTTGNFKWELRRGATVIDTSAEFTFGNFKEWHYFMLKVTCRTGVNGVYELKHFDMQNNETAVFSGNTVNLANQGSDGCDRVYFSFFNDGSNNLELDDIFVFDTTGSKNNNFPTKPLVIMGALPDGVGNQTDWLRASGGNNYLMVDDPANSPADNDKNTSQDVSDIDLYTYSDFAQIDAGTTVIGVQIISTAAMVASGTRTLRVRVRSAAAETFGSNFALSDLVLASTRQVWDQNLTGAPADWTTVTLEAAEFGVEVQA